MIEEIITEIKTKLDNNNYECLGLFPEDIQNIGNNFPSYALRFVSQDNYEYDLGRIESTITLQIYVYVQYGDSAILEQDTIEQDIISKLNMIEFCNTRDIRTVLVNRGPIGGSFDPYNEGYYEGNIAVSSVFFEIDVYNG